MPDSLSVNVAKFDSQHKNLVSYVNELHGAMSNGKGKDSLQGILDKLVRYTKSHFADEEATMQSKGYPQYSLHKLEHDKLTKQVLELQKDLEEGKAVLSFKVMNFLKGWLNNHIQGMDKKYSEFLNSRGIC